MFLITTAYQKARSRRNPDKPGRLLYRITQKEGEDTESTMRTVSSDILGAKNTIVEANRLEIIRDIRMIYAIIENRKNSPDPYSIDDIADDVRQALNGDERMKTVIERANEKFPLRADLVSVGHVFKRDFLFVYPGKKQRSGGLLDYMINLAQEAKNEGKQSMARSFNSTRSSLSKFIDAADIPISEIDKTFLIEYSAWLKANGMKDSTQSFYLRTLRVIINRAKELGLTNANDDMFIGLNTRVKFKAYDEDQPILSREALKKIVALQLHDTPEVEIVRDMFMFGFYCRGMELNDVLNLTKSSIQGDTLIYNRRSNGNPRTIALDSLAQNIIKKYQGTDGLYLFPMKETYRGYQQYSVNEKVRQQLKKIGKAVGYPELTFSANIATWKHLMSQLSVSELLLKSV